MLKGTYIFYENGKEICRSENAITLFGKRFFTNFIAGNITSLRKELAFGIDRKEVLVTAASASAGTVTYTGNNYYSAGDIISIYGLSTTAFNLSNVTVASATSSQFTVVNGATGTAVTNSISGRAYQKAQDTNTRLGFEFYRIPITLSSIDIQTGLTTSYSVIYKTTIPQDVSGLISEIGLYPGEKLISINTDSKFLADFYDSLDWLDTNGNNPLSSNNNSRIGDNVLIFESGSGSAKEYTYNVDLNLSEYSVNDSVTFAYYKYDNNLNKIRLKLYSADDAWYYYDITPQAGIGYKVVPDISLFNLLSNSGGTGTPNTISIVKIGVEVFPTSGTTSIGADGLRINDEDSFDPLFGLISRTALETPLNKITGRAVDVEYRLELGF